MRKSCHRPGSWKWKHFPHKHVAWQPEPGGLRYCWLCGREVIWWQTHGWVVKNWNP